MVNRILSKDGSPLMVCVKSMRRITDAATSLPKISTLLENKNLAPYRNLTDTIQMIAAFLREWSFRLQAIWIGNVISARSVKLSKSVAMNQNGICCISLRKEDMP
jgi:hypothetical protein